MKKKPCWRQDLIGYAIMCEFETFKRMATEVVPEEYKDHVLLRLPIIYQEIQSEVANDFRRTNNDYSRQDNV